MRIPASIRRRLHFSIRGLLVTVLLISVVLAVVVHRARQQEAIVRRVRLLGGNVVYRHEVTVAGTWIPNPRLPGPAWLRRIIGDHYFCRVDSISLPWIRDEDLRFIVRLRSVERFYCDGITDDGLLVIRGWPNLRWLTVESAAITDEGLRHLSDSPKLETIEIVMGPITDEGIQLLGALPNLKTLLLDKTQVTANGIERLKVQKPSLVVNVPAGLPSAPEEMELIKQLCTHGARFRADAAGHVNEIVFIGPDATNKSLLMATKLPRLKSIELFGAHVTPDGVTRFRKARPDVSVGFPDMGLVPAREPDAVSALTAFGAEVHLDEQGFVEHVRYFTSIPGTKLTDEALVPLQNLTCLRGLECLGPGITDIGLRNIENATSIETLWLGNVAISDRGLEQLSRLTNLRNVLLHVPGLTDEGLKVLANWTKLEAVDLQRTRITDSGLVGMTGLSQLHTVRLGGSDVTDQGLVHLGKLSRLELLDLRATRISDRGLRHLRNSTALENLNLSDTAVSDKGLVHLGKLVQLKYLFLDGTMVTQKGADKLAKKLPNCHVSLHP